MGKLDPQSAIPGFRSPALDSESSTLPCEGGADSTGLPNDPPYGCSGRGGGWLGHGNRGVPTSVLDRG
jgi:hypothetical protein